MGKAKRERERIRRAVEAKQKREAAARPAPHVPTAIDDAESKWNHAAYLLEQEINTDAMRMLAAELRGTVDASLVVPAGDDYTAAKQAAADYLEHLAAWREEIAAFHEWRDSSGLFARVHEGDPPGDPDEVQPDHVDDDRPDAVPAPRDPEP